MIHLFYDTTPYVLSPLTIQTLAVAVCIFALGIFGLVREQGSPVSVVYFVLTSSMGLWLFSFSWMYSAIDATLAMWWARVAYVGIAFIPAAVYHFSSLILQDYEKVRKRVLAVWALSAVFITLILATDLQFRSLYRYPWGYYPRSRATSMPFILYFFSVMIIALRSFAAAYRGSSRGSAQWLRARTLLIAFTVGYLAATDFIASFGIPWYPLGYTAIFFFLVVSARSIFHYRFMAITPAFAARQIIDTMKDALIVLDPDGVVRLVNRATCDLLGCRVQDLVGKRPVDSMSRSAVFASQLDSIIRNGTVLNRELEYRQGEEVLRTLSLSVSVMRSPTGDPLASVCVASDVSERKRAEEEREKLIARLQEANRKLQEVDKMKSDFVSLVSHELRTPLTTVKAFAELIIMKPDMPGPERTKLVGIINSEADRLTRLISDLLDNARIEAGLMKWRVEEVSIEDVIQSSLACMGPHFENKKLSVTTDFDTELSGLSGDRDRLVQVVTNILTNAAKFTPAGGSIHIAARRESSPCDQIAVAISDTGAGIKADDLELIFEKFHRSGEEHTGAVQGTGLGLAIARQIVEHHGGRIWAESTHGKGSVFTFTLPLG